LRSTREDNPSCCFAFYPPTFLLPALASPRGGSGPGSGSRTENNSHPLDTPVWCQNSSSPYGCHLMKNSVIEMQVPVASSRSVIEMQDQIFPKPKKEQKMKHSHRSFRCLYFSRPWGQSNCRLYLFAVWMKYLTWRFGIDRASAE